MSKLKMMLRDSLANMQVPSVTVIGSGDKLPKEVIAPTDPAQIPAETTRQPNHEPSEPSRTKDTPVDATTINTTIHPSPTPSIQSIDHPSIPTHIQPSIQLDNYPSIHHSNHPITQPSIQQANRPSEQLSGHPSNNLYSLDRQNTVWAPLAEGQGKVLMFLTETNTGLSNANIISEATGVRYGTTKDALRTLVKYGYITRKERVRLPSFYGFSYLLDTQRCSEYLARVRSYTPSASYHPSEQSSIHPSSYPSIHQIPYPSQQPSIQQNIHPSNQLKSAFSSSSENQKTTTTILTGPEMVYWVELGLKDRQVLKWCEDFNIDPTDIRQQLAWARWDLVNNGKEAEVKKDAINWFFGILKRSAGCYPPAKGYQSPVEIRAARLRDQIDAEVKARSELDTLEAESRFQAVLSDPEGAEYQNLRRELPEAMSGMKGRALETILRERFLAREG
jgi:hypothetical protein